MSAKQEWSQATGERLHRAARSEPRPKGSPPHWLRCDWFNENDERCAKAEGHSGEHEAVKHEQA